jgi:hypothetical protein
MKNLGHLLRLIFAPERFVNGVIELIVEEERVKRRLPEGEFPIERQTEIEENIKNQTKRFRRGIATGLVTMALTIAAGTVSGIVFRSLFGEPAKALIYFLQALGAAVILGATLAEVGDDVTTYGGRSIPEQLNKLIFRSLYVAGTFLFLLSVAWDA